MNTAGINQYRKSEADFHMSLKCQPSEHFIRDEKLGITIRFQIIGSGQPLYFVHGAPAAGSLWWPLVHFLKDYTCIIPDRPGCGLSESVGYINLNRQELAGIFISVTDSILHYLKIKNTALISSSFGSYLSLLYAINNPEKISKLVIEGCPATTVGSILPVFMKIMLYPGIIWLFPRLPLTISLLRKIFQFMGHEQLIRSNLVQDYFFEWYISLFNHTTTLKNEMALVSRVYPAGKLNSDFIFQNHELGKINQPTLWLWGTNDTFGTPETGKLLSSKMQKSQIIFFENSGHLPWIDNPEAHAGYIKKFLSE